MNNQNLIEEARDILNEPEMRCAYRQKDVCAILLAFLLYLDIQPELFKQNKMAAYRSTNLKLKEALEKALQEKNQCVSKTKDSLVVLDQNISGKIMTDRKRVSIALQFCGTSIEARQMITWLQSCMLDLKTNYPNPQDGIITTTITDMANERERENNE